MSTNPCRQWPIAPDTDEATIWFAEVATATFVGMPININNGVIKNPPPTPNNPDNTPTEKLKKSNRKISTFTCAIGR